MPERVGMRCFNCKWTVSSPSTAGAVVSNGRITNPDSSHGYTADSDGVKACLEDFCIPLCVEERNGKGWSLDTDCCPNGEAILLPPNTRVWVMYFKNTSGARLMVGLNYFPMVTYYNGLTVQGADFDWNWSSLSTSSKLADVGFLNEKICGYSTASGYAIRYQGGIFMGMIPPANTGETQEVFDPTISIADTAFYPQTLLPIALLRIVREDNNLGYLNYSYGPMSLLHVGSSDATTSNSVYYSNMLNYGVVLGNTCCYSLLVERDIIGVSSSYNGRMCGKYLIGRICDHLRNSSDTLCTSEYGVLSFSVYNSTYSRYAWHSVNYDGFDQSYYYELSKVCNVTGTKWCQTDINYNTNGYTTPSTVYEFIYSGYVNSAADDEYDNTNEIISGSYIKGRLRSDLLRCCSNSQKTYGQTYNDGEWCFIGSFIQYTYRPSSSGNYRPRLTPNFMIAWDGTFNGTESFRIVS